MKFECTDKLHYIEYFQTVQLLCESSLYDSPTSYLKAFLP